MKRVLNQITVLAFVAALLVPVSLLAQQNDDKDKENKDKNKDETEVITITRKGDKNEKATVVIDGDKITVNGKSIDELKDGDITVRRNKFKSFRNSYSVGGSYNGMNLFGDDENHAMLGVTTERVDEGVQVQDVTKESAAEKIGLKEKDIITKIDDQKVEDPDDLSKVISKHKPGEKVKVTFLRDKKEQTATAELTKWKGVGVYNIGDGENFNYNFKMPDINYNTMPRLQGLSRGYGGVLTVAGRPRLGLSVQDTDDGKGAKVLDVDDEGVASKSGVKEGDLITEIDGKAIAGADDVAKAVRESKDKSSFMLKIQRDGKTQNIEVKIPKKLKTADL